METLFRLQSLTFSRTVDKGKGKVINVRDCRSIVRIAEMTNVTVVGLSDVGRSPRFQYHCMSLAQEGFHVNVIGYKGAKPKKQLSSDPNVSITYLATVPEFNKCESKNCQLF